MRCESALHAQRVGLACAAPPARRVTHLACRPLEPRPAAPFRCRLSLTHARARPCCRTRPFCRCATRRWASSARRCRSRTWARSLRSMRRSRAARQSRPLAAARGPTTCSCGCSARRHTTRCAVTPLAWCGALLRCAALRSAVACAPCCRPAAAHVPLALRTTTLPRRRPLPTRACHRRRRAAQPSAHLLLLRQGPVHARRRVPVPTRDA